MNRHITTAFCNFRLDFQSTTEKKWPPARSRETGGGPDAWRGEEEGEAVAAATAGKRQTQPAG